jgi:hypothetical protein
MSVEQSGACLELESHVNEVALYPNLSIKKRLYHRNGAILLLTNESSSTLCICTTSLHSEPMAFAHFDEEHIFAIDFIAAAITH